MSSTTASTSKASSSSAKVVALPSMTHSLSHLPNMPTVDPRCLHYGALGASKEASHAKLQQTLQRRDTASVYSGGGGANSSQHSRHHYYSTSQRKGSSTADDGDYLMMNTGRRKQ